MSKLSAKKNNLNTTKILGAQTELVLASFEGKKEKVKLFLKNGANPNIQNPWEVASENFKIGAEIEGRVTRVQPYGAFVEICEGVEGLVHVSDLTWNKKKINVSDFIKVGDIVKVKIMEFDAASRKLKLGVKQLCQNPWKYWTSEVVEINKEKKEMKLPIKKIELDTSLNRECNIEMKDIFEKKPDSKVTAIPQKKLFIRNRFFKNSYTKKLDKEMLERTLWEKGNLLLNVDEHTEIPIGLGVKKIHHNELDKYNLFELRLNSGDRVLYSRTEEGIIFLNANIHDKAISEGKRISSYTKEELNFESEYKSENKLEKIEEVPFDYEYYGYISSEEFAKNYNTLNKSNFYMLSEKQAEIISKPLPLTVSGIAGSGKTTMLLKKIEKQLEKDEENSILFVTYNKNLLEYSQLMYETYSGLRTNNIKFASFIELFIEKLNLDRKNYFTFEKFEKWLEDRYFKFKDRKIYLNNTEIWIEIRGLLKGFVGFENKRDLSNEEIISQNYYLSLVKDYSIIKDESQREEVYKLAIDYQKYLHRYKYFDENDLAFMILQKDVALKEYNFLACDEIQDLTEIQIIALFKFISNNDNFVFVGDPNQSINLSFFTFKRLETFLQSNFKIKNKTYYLNENQRNQENISNLAYELKSIKSSTSDKEIEEIKEIAIRRAESPNKFMEINLSQLKETAEKDITIIVPKEEMKRELEENYSLRGKVFYPYELKGLERKNILCYGFAKEYKSEFDYICEKLGSNENFPNYYNHLLNLIYVSYTRARDTLTIMDDEHDLYTLLGGHFVRTDTIEGATLTDEIILEYGREHELNEQYESALKQYERLEDEALKELKIKEMNANILLTENMYVESLSIFDELQNWKKCLEVSQIMKNSEYMIKYAEEYYLPQNMIVELARVYYEAGEKKKSFETYLEEYKRENSGILKEDREKIENIFSDSKNTEYLVLELEKIEKFLSVDSIFENLYLDILVATENFEKISKVIVSNEFKKRKVLDDFSLWSFGFEGFNHLNFSKLKPEKIYKFNYLKSKEIPQEFYNRVYLKNRGKEKFFNFLLENKKLMSQFVFQREDIHKLLSEEHKLLSEEKHKNLKILFEHSPSEVLNIIKENDLPIGKLLTELINDMLSKKDKKLVNLFNKEYGGFVDFKNIDFISLLRKEEYKTNFINSIDTSKIKIKDIFTEEIEEKNQHSLLKKFLESKNNYLSSEEFSLIPSVFQSEFSKYFIESEEKEINLQLSIYNFVGEEGELFINGIKLKTLQSRYCENLLNLNLEPLTIGFITKNRKFEKYIEIDELLSENPRVIFKD